MPSGEYKILNTAANQRILLIQHSEEKELAKSWFKHRAYCNKVSKQKRLYCPEQQASLRMNCTVYIQSQGKWYEMPNSWLLRRDRKIAKRR